MKKNIALLIITLALGLLAYSLYSKKGDGKDSMGQMPDRTFGVKDISTISKISIQQPEYPVINFVHQENGWIMNGKKNTNEYVINDFLGLISRVDVDYIPTTKMTKTILDLLPENGINIKIWDKNDVLIRDFIVGTEIGNNGGTPFLVKGASQPYVMRVPGFDGSLRSRILNKMNEWESKDVYNIDPKTIESVEVSYDRDADASFIVAKKEGNFTISKPNNPTKTETPNPKTAEAYFAFFRYIVAEYNDSENPNRQRIKEGQRFAKITVLTKDGQKSEIDYFSYADIDTKIETKSPHQIHPDNKFFAETNENEMMLVQQRVIWQIFRTYDYFL